MKQFVINFQKKKEENFKKNAHLLAYTCLLTQLFRPDIHNTHIARTHQTQTNTQNVCVYVCSVILSTRIYMHDNFWGLFLSADAIGQRVYTNRKSAEAKKKFRFFKKKNGKRKCRTLLHIQYAFVYKLSIFLFALHRCLCCCYTYILVVHWRFTARFHFA